MMKKNYIIMNGMVNKMSTITDKELLAICNLTGLNLEFADLKNKTAEAGQSKNHTIYSLLIQERDGILNQAVKNRAFFNLVNDQTLDAKETALYNSVAELKKAAGMAYEYVEKAALENAEGNFTKEWEIVFAADSYKLNSIIHQKFRRK